ncbi:DNA adenine methylase, partial [Chromobacterium phragmitis]
SGFRANGNRQSAHPARDWSNYPAALAGMLERLTGVVIENRQATDVILQHDSPQTLHYCDPPYVLDTRSSSVTRSGKGYRHEMTDADHAHLAQVLHECAGMVVLSGYDSPLYNELYAGWERSTRRALADGALERTEVIWLNPACSAALHQNDLFKEIA